MAGLEVEDLPRPAVPAAAGAEQLAAAEPAAEDDFIRIGNIEMLAVHLFLFQLKPSGDTFGDGMAGIHAPHPLKIAVPPAQGAGGTHQEAERLGIMAGVEHDEAHAP